MDTFESSGSPHRTTEEHLPEGLDLAGQLSFERIAVRLGLGAGKVGGARRIGDFELRRTLGEGGMGIVYLAHDPKLDREVAIKLIQTRRHLSPKTLRVRLLREGRALAQLDHANVVGVHESGEHEGEPYLVMEYVDGDTLRAWQREAEPSRDELLRVFIAAGNGLAAAHAADIVHRDFKPENVLVGANGRVQVSDFGLADLLHAPVNALETQPVAESSDGEDSGRLTQASEILGTLGYMAPEQLRGEPADARSDQFAYCATLWEVLTGALPFRGSSRQTIVDATFAGELDGGQDLPWRLRKLLTRGLASEPEQRHPSMQVLVDALVRQRGQRGRWMTGALGVALLSATVGITLALAHNDASQRCKLQTEVEQASLDWGPLRARLGQAQGRLDPLESSLRALEANTEALCESGSPAQREYARTWLKELEDLLNSPAEAPLELLLGRSEALRERSWDRAPSKPVSPEVATLLAQAGELELRNKLDAAQAKIAEARSMAIELAGTRRRHGPSEPSLNVDQAEIDLRAGRLLTLADNYAEANLAYQDATKHAEISTDDDTRLWAYLREAELAIKRLEQLEVGRSLVIKIEGLLARTGEPIISERRASYHNLRATIRRREGNTTKALSEQRRATGLLLLAGAPAYRLARSLVALGVIHETRGEAHATELCYRLALTLVQGPSPDRAHAVFALGNFLANELVADPSHAARMREARALLEEAAETRPELRLVARTQLLNLALVDEAIDELTLVSMAEQLEFEFERSGGTPSHRWAASRAIAFVYAGDSPPSTRFERALKTSYSLAPDSPLDLASYERSLAGMSLDAEQRQALVAKARARLELLPPSAEREWLLSSFDEFDTISD